MERLSEARMRLIDVSAAIPVSSVDEERQPIVAVESHIKPTIRGTLTAIWAALGGTS
jgi:hypothetical protein